jgi:hypothetical protein
MSDPRRPFKSDYGDESQATASPAKAEPPLVAPEGAAPASQTESTEAPILQRVDKLIEPGRYGTGKPRRVVIRGRISK